MPEISRFYGIVITMFYADHPPPHFHARYGEQKAIVAIDDGGLLVGHISARSLRLIREWPELHKTELTENWNCARSKMALKAIEPLE